MNLQTTSMKNFIQIGILLFLHTELIFGSDILVKKKHIFKHGNCNPLVTNLAMGTRTLHESSVKEETFYFKPKSTFRRIILRVRLDNIITQTPPKLYDTRVEFSSNDLLKLNYTDSEWLRVNAEVYKRKSLFQESYMLKLSVGDWMKEAEMQKWRFFYAFENLVFMGEGGAEWSFDCHPHNVLEVSANQGHIEWYWFMALSILVVFVAFLLCCCFIVFCYKCCNRYNISHSLPSTSVSVST